MFAPPVYGSIELRAIQLGGVLLEVKPGHAGVTVAKKLTDERRVVCALAVGGIVFDPVSTGITQLRPSYLHAYRVAVLFELAGKAVVFAFPIWFLIDQRQDLQLLPPYEQQAVCITPAIVSSAFDQIMCDGQSLCLVGTVVLCLRRAMYLSSVR